MSLKKKLVKLAYEQKELRPHLMPLIKEAYAQEDTPPGASVLPFDASFVVPLRAGLEDLFKASKALKARVDQAGDAYSDQVPFLQAWIRQIDAELAQATYKIKRSLRKSLPHVEKSLAAATAGYKLASTDHTAGGRDWFRSYMRVFHPMLTSLYRWVKGPLHPEPAKEFETLLKACQALYDSAQTLTKLVDEALKKAKFFFQDTSTKAVYNNLAMLSTDMVGLEDSVMEVRLSMQGALDNLKKGAMVPESWTAI